MDKTNFVHGQMPWTKYFLSTDKKCQFLNIKKSIMIHHTVVTRHLIGEADDRFLILNKLLTFLVAFLLEQCVLVGFCPVWQVFVRFGKFLSRIYPFCPEILPNDEINWMVDFFDLDKKSCPRTKKILSPNVPAESTLKY